MEQLKYRAFISYSHQDAQWGNWLHGALESYRLPKSLVGVVTERGAVPKRLTPIFRDREELATASDLGAILTAALQQSAGLIVICSPQSARSRWVNEEVLAFKRLGRDDRILCLIVAGEPNASDDPAQGDQECFPPALRFKLGPDRELSAVRAEPIAADARPGKDGKARAKLKLIAGLLGLGFDALARREQQRRLRRMVAIASGASAGMVLTSGLATYAFMQRVAAQRQTVRAESEARTARETARFLVDLFKISNPSEARGNTVTAREMLDKGATRVEHELAKEPAIQATLMDTLGTVYIGLGLYGAAKPLLDRAVDTRRRLPGVDPLDLSDSLRHQGDLLSVQADYLTGEKFYREAVAIESSRPKDPQSQAQRADSLYGLGTLLAKEGRYADAEKSLRDALRLQQEIYRAPHAAIARTIKDLARVVADAGNLNGAIPLMRSAVDMQRHLWGNEPHPDLAEVLNDMGLLYYEDGNLEQAEKFYRESLGMNRRLLGDRHPEIANGLENVAMTLQDRGDLAGAEPLYKASIDLRRELLGASHPEVGRTLLNLATLKYDRGKTKEALADGREVLAIYREAYSADHPSTAIVLNVIGFWLTRAGDYGAAEVYVRDGLAMRRRLFRDDQPDVASSLTVLAVLRHAQGRHSEALQLAQQAKDVYAAALSADHWRTAIAESVEGAALTGLGRLPGAEIALNHSFRILSTTPAAPLPYRVLAQDYLNALHRRQRVAPGAAPSSALAARSPAAVAPALEHR